MAGRVPTRLSPSEGRKFGLTVGVAFAVLSGIAWWRERSILMQVFGGLAVLLIAAGVFIPGKLGPVNRAWMGLVHLISRVTTPIFLAIVYFVVISPSGLLMRLFGHNPLEHRQAEGSFWLSRSDRRGSMSDRF